MISSASYLISEWRVVNSSNPSCPGSCDKPSLSLASFLSSAVRVDSSYSKILLSRSFLFSGVMASSSLAIPVIAPSSARICSSVLPSFIPSSIRLSRSFSTSGSYVSSTKNLPNAVSPYSSIRLSSNDSASLRRCTLSKSTGLMFFFKTPSERLCLSSFCSWYIPLGKCLTGRLTIEKVGRVKYVCLL